MGQKCDSGSHIWPRESRVERIYRYRVNKTYDICQKCYKQRPKSTLNTRTLSDLDRGLAVSSIQDANQTQLRIMADIPSQLRRLWGQCVTSVLDRFAHDRTDRESFQTLESWTKLKCVLVLPVMGGEQKASLEDAIPQKTNAPVVCREHRRMLVWRPSRWTRPRISTETRK